MKAKKKSGRRGNPEIAKAGEGTRFKPGVSPNPGGRPKYASFSEAIREVGSLTVRQLRSSKDDSVKVGIAKALARAAIHGKVSAASELIDRSEGRARQALDLTHKGPVQIVVSYEPPVEHPKNPQPTAAPNLFAALVDLVSRTNDERIMTAASGLALLLKSQATEKQNDANKKP